MKNFFGKATEKIKENKKKTIFGSILLIVVVLIALGAAGKKEGESATHVAALTTVTEEVNIAGRVQSIFSADLAFSASGKITEVNARVGDEVKKGQRLMSLDAGTLYADLKEAEAEVSIKKAELENAEGNLDDIIDQQEVLVANAYRTLLSEDLVAVSSSRTETAAPPIISGIYRGSVEGRYKIILEREGNDRNIITMGVFGLEEFKGKVGDDKPYPLGQRGLYIRLVDPINDYSNTMWYVDVPNTTGASYGANLNTYEAAVEAQQVAVREAEASLTSDSFETSIARAELAQAEARVSRIGAQLEERIIRAPFDGIVTRQEGEVGEIFAHDTVAMSIIAEGAFEIEAELPEIDVAKVREGDMATVTLDSYGDALEFPATVAAVAAGETLSDGVPVYELTLTFTETDERIKSGMTTNILIITDQRRNTVAVPWRAITKKGTEETVTVVDEEGDTEERVVRTGLRGSDGMVQILRGLEAGETVRLN